MLLAEQVRRMTNEKRFIVDAGPYSYTTTSWGTLKDFGNVTLDVDGFLVFKYTIAVEAFTGHAGNHRLKVGSYYCSGDPMSENQTQTIVGMVDLAAGTYQVLFEARAKSRGKYVRVTAVEVGLVDVADVAYNALGEYGAAIEKTLTARATCVGPIAS